MHLLQQLWNGGLDPQTADPTQLRHRRTLAGTGLLLLPVGLGVIVHNSAIGDHLDNVGIAIAMVFVVVLLALQAWADRSRLAAQGLTACLFGAASFGLFNSGYTNFGWGWMVAVPVVGTLLAGRRAGMAWVALSAAMLWLVAAVEPWLVAVPTADRFGLAVEGTLMTLVVAVPVLAARTNQDRAERGLAATVERLRAENEQRAAAEQAARQAAEEARRAERAKATFLATMSHELRTPMNGVLGATQLLTDTRLSEDQRELTETIASSGQVLLDVINDILDLSRLEADRLVVEQIPTDLRVVVARVAVSLRQAARAKGVALTAEVDDDVPRWVVADPQRLTQILLNLAGNAVKFTAEGAVTIDVHREGDTLVLAVSDTGIGIPDEVIPELFRPFRQADSSTSRRFGGSGLGLSIVHGLVEQMEGEVLVTSTVGEGSRFEVRLPLHTTDTADDLASETTGDGLGPLHVLLVDDNAVNRLVARKMLERIGHTVDEADGGQAALEALSSTRYDAALLDVHMPDLDGYEVARRVRDLPPPHGRVPLVGLTADALPEHREQTLAAGMDAHLSKPVDLRDLHRVLRHVAEPSGARRAG